ncbi:polysaccharide biosynthesis protein [Gloeothece citriformis PCC 7424]|uniref:Polysaccharide biosynthesis protein n=1 Tax=Gloeothece citriformis (strain PCC 7424) TaxID=65393 RepID=B7KKU7_GLOC7|nr:oligosaccharide flippase family protein [Gloeothece citriformis]ACK71066.1 polysaccharide biosynthesis protein [Gloeothece citriformis PCC 7424]
MSSLKQKAIKGTIWTLVGYGCGNVLRLANNLILTRLLEPELFGLMALANSFLTGINLFSDIGIKPSIIQNERGDDPDFLNTAWTLQVIRSWFIWLVCLVASVPLSKFYNEPVIGWLLPLIGFSVIINGFSSTNIATLNRRLMVAKLTLFNLVVKSISLVVMVIWALFNPTIWALVVGNFCSSVFGMIRSYLILPGKFNRFAWDKSAVKELFSFGRWVFISTIMVFLATQADRLILGKLVSKEMLGVYSVAFIFSQIPKNLLSSVNQQVIFPIISSQKDLPRKQLRAKIEKKRWLILFGLMAIIILLGSFGDIIILNLYDQRYYDAAWMLPILAVGMWPFVLNQTNSPALIAIGKPFYLAIGNFSKFMFMVILLPPAFQSMGLLGAIIVVAFNDLPVYVGMNYGLWREKLASNLQDFICTIILIVLLALVLAGRYYLGFGFPLERIINI